MKRDLQRDGGRGPENSVVNVMGKVLIKIDIASDITNANKWTIILKSILSMTNLILGLPSAATETSLNENASWKLRTSASR